MTYFKKTLFFILHIFLEVDKTQDLLSKIWQTIGATLILSIGVQISDVTSEKFSTKDSNNVITKES
jgi:hypothetical protein